MTTIATWNLHHMGREVKIPKGVLPVIEAERPDVLVLTEWVDRGRRADFLYGLQRVGYGHVHQSAAAKGQNQVLVASTVEQEDGAVQAPDVQVPDVDEAAQTNFLHRFLPSKRLHVVGFRVPHYQSEKPRKPEKLERLLAAVHAHGARAREPEGRVHRGLQRRQHEGGCSGAGGAPQAREGRVSDVCRGGRARSGAGESVAGGAVVLGGVRGRRDIGFAGAKAGREPLVGPSHARLGCRVSRRHGGGEDGE